MKVVLTLVTLGLKEELHSANNRLLGIYYGSEAEQVESKSSVQLLEEIKFLETELYLSADGRAGL